MKPDCIGKGSEKAGLGESKTQETNLALIRRKDSSSIKTGGKENRLGTGESRIICLVLRRWRMG